MAKMKALDGYQPSEEDEKKINDFVTYLEEHGYKGIMIISKEGVGVSWAKIKNDESVCHLLINSISHIASDNEGAAVELAGGIILAAKQLTE